MKCLLRIALLLIVCTVCSVATYAQGICTDSSFRTIYTSTADLFFARHHITTADQGMLMIGAWGITGTDDATFIMRNEPGGNILWSKKISLTNNRITLLRALELSDKSILLIGNNREPVSGNYTVILVKLDALGGLSWSRSYIQQTPFDPTDGLLTYTATEAPNGELLVAWRGIHQKGDGNDHSYATVCRLTATGTMVWSKTFITYGSAAAVDISGVFLSNNSVIVTGNVSDANVQATCSGTGSFMLMRLSYTDGTLLQLKTYCYEEPTNNVLLFPNPEIFYSATLLNSGNLVLFGRFQHFDQQTYYYKVMVSGQLDKLQSTAYVIPQAVALVNSRAQVNSSGELHLTAANYLRKQIYYASFREDDSEIWQGTIPFTADNNNSQLNYQYMQVSQERKVLSTNYILGGRPTIEISNLSNGMVTGLPCMGSDTAFTTKIPFPIQAVNWTWGSVLDNNVSSTPVILNEAGVTISAAVICKQVNQCDKIKISGPETICQPGQSYRFAVDRNDGCTQRIGWEYNTAWTRSMTYENDTTVVIRFKDPVSQPQQFYLYAGICDAVKDSLLITLLPPALSLGNDSAICSGQQVTFSPGNWMNTYTWQDGSTNASFVATLPGTYYVKATTACNEEFNDTVQVTTYPLVRLGEDSSICNRQSFTMDAGAGFTSYAWNTGATTRMITVDRPGLYAITAKDSIGCLSSDTLVMMQKPVSDCTNYLLFPSAFSPNGDRNNDVFKPLVRGSVDQFELVIYNRWGQLVFKTDKSSAGWNGNVGGRQQSTGVYIWVCKYRFTGGAIQTKKGSCMLIH